MVATASMDKTCKIWDTRTGRLIDTLRYCGVQEHCGIDTMEYSGVL